MGMPFGFLWKPERATFLKLCVNWQQSVESRYQKRARKARSSGGSANGKNRSSDDFSMCRISSQDTTVISCSVPLAKGLWDVIDGRQTADRFITSFIHDFVE